MRIMKLNTRKCVYIDNQWP